jgi:hypothetical protein
MKKIVLLTTVIALFLCSCTKNTTTELTAEQKATIEKEVKDQFDKFYSTWDKLDFNSWSEYWSKDGFISATSNMDYVSERGEMIDNVKESWSMKERRITELSDVKFTALTSDLVYGIIFENVEVWEKSGDHYKVKASGSVIWKKEQGGWKMILAHESGQLIE